MTREQLEHAIRAACDVSEDGEIWIFGSQAILGEFPNAPKNLRTSIEVDVQPRNRPERIDVIDGTLGELSLFHHTHGFYVHGVSIESAKLPIGWEKRVTRVCDELATRGNIGWCIEKHDLAASKLAAYREKDRDFVRTLLLERMIDADTLKRRIERLPVEKGHRESLIHWLQVTRDEM